jgi:hypothetical protein
MAVLAALALAGLAGCGIQPDFPHAAASPSGTGPGPCRAGDSGAGASTAPCPVTNPQALQRSNERYLQRQRVPAAQVAAAEPLRRRVQRGLQALTARQWLRPAAVKDALVAAGLPATVYLLTGNDGTLRQRLPGAVIVDNGSATAARSYEFPLSLGPNKRDAGHMGTVGGNDAARAVPSRVLIVGIFWHFFQGRV